VTESETEELLKLMRLIAVEARVPALTQRVENIEDMLLGQRVSRIEDIIAKLEWAFNVPAKKEHADYMNTVEAHIRENK